MTLNPDRWFVRWFFVALAIIEDFTENYGLVHHVRADGTNLCYFVRASTIYPLGIVALHLAVLALLLCDAFVIPMYFLGAVSYGVFWLWALAVVAAAVLLFLAVRWYLSWLADRDDDTRDDTPGALAVAGAWIMAKKQRICPLIAFSPAPTAPALHLTQDD